MLSVDATSPLTAICAPVPNRIPLGLMRKTRPFDCEAPTICDGFYLTTRLGTLLLALCWMKRAASLLPIEKLCQLITAPVVLVTDSGLPCCANLAWTLTTCGPSGLTSAAPKPPAMSSGSNLRRSLSVLRSPMR